MGNEKRPVKDYVDFNGASFLSLNYRPISEQAFAFGEELGLLMFGPLSKANKAGRPFDRKGAVNAALSIIAETVDLTEGNVLKAVCHGMTPDDFTGQVVSYRSFVKASAKLEGNNLLKRTKGHWNKQSAFATVENPGVGFGKVTRWQAQESLFVLANTFGINSKTIQTHFSIDLPKHPLELRSSSRWSDRGKIYGRKVKFRPTEITNRLQSEVLEINEFLKNHALQGASHRAYRRIFNNGDNLADYNWNKGGRLYGDSRKDHYLIIRRDDRKHIKIDGEETIEVDIRASFLTIFSQLNGCEVDPSRDPYAIDGLPRSVVKQWVVSAFGQGKVPLRWPSVACAEFLESSTDGKRLGKVYPLKEINHVILNAIPVLKSLSDSKYNSLDLMFLESNAIICAMLRLQREVQVPAYAIHDSLMVKKGDQDIAAKILSEAYFEQIGVVPELSFS
jgi:hypothetical protein